MNRPSQLERMIDRLIAQRAHLGHAAALMQNLPGPILEVGLGKGRTYDYLRALFPEREIFAFDRSVHAPDDYVPDAGHLILGDFRQTLPNALAQIGEPAALVHADIGTTDPTTDRALVTDVREALTALTRPGGLIVSDRELSPDGAESLSAPPDAGPWPYFIYRL